MRIITGEYRGRRIETPYGKDVRPTSDKVKEAIFSILYDNIFNAVVVDLFAGTGNLGLEALSRGAMRAYFGDNSKESIKFIKANVEKCGAESKSKIIFADYMKVLQRINEKIDIFFVDPPYDSGLYEKVLTSIDTLDLLSNDGIIITEHDKNMCMQDRIGKLIKFKVRHYGKISISLYRNMVEDEL